MLIELYAKICLTTYSTTFGFLTKKKKKNKKTKSRLCSPFICGWYVWICTLVLNFSFILLHNYLSKHTHTHRGKIKPKKKERGKIVPSLKQSYLILLAASLTTRLSHLLELAGMCQFSVEPNSKCLILFHVFPCPLEQQYKLFLPSSSYPIAKV